MAKRSKNRSKKINSSDLYPIAVIFALYAMVYKDSALQILTFVVAIGAIAGFVFVLYTILPGTNKPDTYNSNRYYPTKKAPSGTYRNESQINKPYGYSSTSAPAPKVTNDRHPLTEPYYERRARNTPKPDRWTLGLINELEWKAFEDLCAEYYKAQGLIAKTTGIGADGGIDIDLFDEDDKAQRKLVGIVQCKAWNAQVGVKDVRELYGVMAHRNAPYAVFITSGNFSKPAIREFGGGGKIKLVDGIMLYAAIISLDQDDQDELLREITSGDYTTPTCPSCGIKMIMRIGRKGRGDRFWGCKNFPQCRTSLRMRAS